MAESTTSRGRAGEDRAAHYLEQNGYVILARNFRSTGGEVDIVAGSGTVVAFVEVKSWNRMPADALEWSINAAKQQRLLRTARRYLYQYPDQRDRRIRFDVMYVPAAGGEIRHIEGAFESPCPE